ncbi:MAG TPA: flagellar basal body rod protein FlgB [Xanthobacteraceae bacterium]|nr:flagellar basal body rod protein FlgB [Xanthobacteraceae bacterium]
MPITNIPIFSMLRTRMQWHQERQRVLAENVANADTPGFRPSDLAPPKFDDEPRPAAVTLVRTAAAHITGAGGGSGAFAVKAVKGLQIQPGGNGVSLEDEMMKVASNQMDYQAAAALYSRSLGLIKLALGKE